MMAYATVMAAPSVGVAIPEINEPMATKGASNSHLACHKTNFNGSDSVCACCMATPLFKADLVDGPLLKIHQIQASKNHQDSRNQARYKHGVDRNSGHDGVHDERHRRR